jgi:MtrB/PioB family decaheme-associated outer membrane protein
MMFTTLMMLGATASTAYAQGSENNEGRIELGVRQLYGERNSAKFKEYRDIPQGFFVKQAEVNLDNLFKNSFFFSFQTRDPRENDQTFLFSLGAYRKYRLDLKWDQTPHVFTTTAKSFLVENTPGVFLAPDPVKTALVAAGTNVSVLQSVLASSPLVNMSLRRDKGSGTLALTPRTDWTVKLNYSHEKMYGHRPFGTTTNSFTNVIELPEPIDYRTNLVNTGAEYADKIWDFQTAYSGSFFHNNVDTITWDVPFATTGTQSTRGRIDLYPSNNAQNFSFAGAVNIPRKTRLIASVVPGWMHQNDSFMPLTINPLLTGLAAQPASSLDGKKQTLAMNYTLTTKAIKKLPLTLRYTTYDYNNNTPSLTFSQVVITDASISGPFTTEPFGYNRKNLALNASYEFLKNSDVKFIYNWERFNREEREADESTENTVGGSFDLNPYSWLLLRGSYKHGDRDPKEYIGGAAMLPSLRKYDEAGRTRHRGEALLQVTPVDPLSFSASYGTTQDAFRQKGCVWLGLDQCYGLLKDISYTYTFELSYAPTSDVSLFAEYTKEKYNYRQRSRQRNPVSGTTPANDSPNNDWEATRRDKVDNYAAGLTATLNPKAVIDLFYSLSVAQNKLFTRALGNPAIAGYLVTTAPPYPGVADYPDTSNRWHQMVASIKCPLLSGNLTPKVEYRYEKYDRVDFQLVNVGQYFTDPQLTSSVFLGVGEDVPGYNAHIISASLEYRF